ncbi:unnamed protein product [Larinioides sclopetarius]|uniref:Uncharacterized protein n=1 Tax=Larinioides sclopetarius TaxID=280406 RepID=A0AAV2B3Y3_9ARAC
MRIALILEYKIGLGKKRGSNLSQPAVAAGAFEAVLVPELVEGFQQIPFPDWFLTGRTISTLCERPGDGSTVHGQSGIP